MSIKDVPDLESVKYSEPITIKVDAETKRLWDDLRRVHKKNNSEWGRQLLKEAFKKLKASAG